MDELDPLPIVIAGIGILMVWGGESPVQRVKSILTKGGVQSGTAQTTTVTADPTNSLNRIQVRGDYLA